MSGAACLLLLALLACVDWTSALCERDVDESETVFYLSADGVTMLQAQLFTPTTGSGPWPTMVFLHGSGGLYRPRDSTTEPLRMEREFREWACILTERGYAAFFPASFYPRGFYDWNDSAPTYLDKEDRLVFRMDDIFGTQTYLQTRSDVIIYDRMAVGGASDGGTISMFVTHWKLDDVEELQLFPPTVFKASFPIYPGCGFQGFVTFSESPSRADDMYWPTIPTHIFHASEDSLLTNCEMREAQTDIVSSAYYSSTNPLDMIVYEDCTHGFDSTPDDATELAAMFDTRNRTLDLLDIYLALSTTHTLTPTVGSGVEMVFGDTVKVGSSGGIWSKCGGDAYVDVCALLDSSALPNANYEFNSETDFCLAHTGVCVVVGSSSTATYACGGVSLCDSPSLSLYPSSSVPVSAAVNVGPFSVDSVGGVYVCGVKVC